MLKNRNGAGLRVACRRRALLLAFGLLALLLPCAYSAPPLKTTIEGLDKPPVIDKHDIRFSRLMVNGESLRSRIHDIVQDNDGFLWIGTFDGLYRYDGNRLKPYRHERDNSNSVSNDYITSLYKDRDGSLWIGTKDGGLDRLDPRQDTFTHYHHESGNPGSLLSDKVKCVYRDRSGRLWVCTSNGLDRLDMVHGSFIHYRHDPLRTDSLSSNNVICVYEDRRGTLWVGTSKGLNKLDPASDRFSRFLHDPRNPHSIGSDFVNFMLEDHAGTLWLSSPLGSGLSALDSKTGEFTSYSFHEEEPSSGSVVGVNTVFEDRDNVLWLCTVDDGLLELDKDRKTFTRYAHEPGNPNSLPHDTVQVLFEDAEGLMWLGTQSGVGRFQRRQPSFVTYQHEAGNPNSLHNDGIWSVQADSQGFLWIGDEDGLDRLNLRTGQFTFYKHDRKLADSLSYNKVSAIREDKSGELWFATYGGGLDRFDPATGHFVNYRHDPKDPTSLSSNAVLSLLIDPHGTLWVGTQGGGLDRFDPRTGHFTSYLNDPPNPNFLLLTVFEDRAATLWIGTQDEGLFRLDPETGKFTVYEHKSDDPQSLSNNRVNAVWEDREGGLWVGTESGLDLLDRKSGKTVIFTTKDGLPDNAIKSILEDRRGYLWLGTHGGLSRFDPLGRTFRNYFEANGLAGNFLNPYAAEGSCQTPQGEMVFGSNNGLTVFQPSRVSENPYVPPVRLTDFLLFNRPVGRGRDSPLTRSIWATDSLTLTHGQSIFTLEFAALSYMAPEMNRYRYRLEPLESQWNEVDSRRRSATYTNLSAGTYLFRVQGSNNDGVWNSKGVALRIAILPPWWATWWFRSILTLLTAGMIWAIYRSRLHSLQLQTARLELQVMQRTHELELTKDAAEQAKDAAVDAKHTAERANEAKTIFLANMSHELRTPLNAILGFSNLLRESHMPQEHRRDLNIINRSGEHLLTLINDVLDMAKIDAGRIVIENAPVDLSDLAHGVLDLMSMRAKEKRIDLSLQQTSGFCRFVESDGEKLRQVLLNLVGNAVKYTEHGGVALRIDTRPTKDPQCCQLVIEVQDTGVGIAAEEQARIFEPFVQAGRISKQKGTGLGLAITKRFIELMGGTIQIESAPGKGSVFRAEIPVLKAKRSEMPVAVVQRGRLIGLESGQPECRVLIVEDQEENWLLLQRLLENTGFKTLVAQDGTSGIEKFITWRPHFIWMDWRLPDMDGLEVTRRIRRLEGGQDVRVVILSAFAFTEYRDQALAVGVDDFVSKPFRAEEIFDCLARHLGVRYTYRAAANEKVADALGNEELASLSVELRKELANAVILLDKQRIAGVIDRIATQNPVLGNTLSQYADRFEYSSILKALQSSEPVTPQMPGA